MVLAGQSEKPCPTPHPSHLRLGLHPLGTLTEEQRVSWCVAGKKKKTRRRLGLSWPLPGFNYFVKINVALAYRGQAQTDLPPKDSPPPGTPAPDLSLVLLPPAPQPGTESPPPAPESTGRAPPPTG